VKVQSGKRISKVLDNISMAKKFESKLKTQNLEGSLFGIKTVPTIDEIWPKYLEWAKDAKKSWKDDEVRWKCHVEGNLSLLPRVNLFMDRIITAKTCISLRRSLHQGPQAKPQEHI
jgi:hypothetical protein